MEIIEDLTTKAMIFLLALMVYKGVKKQEQNSDILQKQIIELTIKVDSLKNK